MRSKTIDFGEAKGGLQRLAAEGKLSPESKETLEKVWGSKTALSRNNLFVETARSLSGKPSEERQAVFALIRELDKQEAKPKTPKKKKTPLDDAIAGMDSADEYFRILDERYKRNLEIASPGLTFGQLNEAGDTDEIFSALESTLLAGPPTPDEFKRRINLISPEIIQRSWADKRTENRGSNHAPSKYIDFLRIVVSSPSKKAERLLEIVYGTLFADSGVRERIFDYSGDPEMEFYKILEQICKHPDIFVRLYEDFPDSWIESFSAFSESEQPALKLEFLMDIEKLQNGNGASANPFERSVGFYNLLLARDLSEDIIIDRKGQLLQLASRYPPILDEGGVGFEWFFTFDSEEEFDRKLESAMQYREVFGKAPLMENLFNAFHRMEGEERKKLVEEFKRYWRAIQSAQKPEKPPELPPEIMEEITFFSVNSKSLTKESYQESMRKAGEKEIPPPNFTKGFVLELEATKRVSVRLEEKQQKRVLDIIKRIGSRKTEGVDSEREMEDVDANIAHMLSFQLPLLRNLDGEMAEVAKAAASVDVELCEELASKREFKQLNEVLKFGIREAEFDRARASLELFKLTCQNQMKARAIRKVAPLLINSLALSNPTFKMQLERLETVKEPTKRDARLLNEVITEIVSNTPPHAR